MADNMAIMRKQIVRAYIQLTPHSDAMGAEVVDYGHGLAVMQLPFREHFLGDIDAGLWHSSVGVSLMDSACGLSVLLALPRIESIATLDLRTDYLRPAVAGEPLFARAECYHLTRHIAFVRGELYQHSRDRLTGRCTAAFMRISRKRKPPYLQDGKP